MRELSLSVVGLFNRHADLRGSAEILAAYGDIDADGCDRSFHGRAKPDGSFDDAVQHHAER